MLKIITYSNILVLLSAFKIGKLLELSHWLIINAKLKLLSFVRLDIFFIFNFYVGGASSTVAAEERLIGNQCLRVKRPPNELKRATKVPQTALNLIYPISITLVFFYSSSQKLYFSEKNVCNTHEKN